MPSRAFGIRVGRQHGIDRGAECDEIDGLD